MLPEFRVPIILGEPDARQQSALLVQDVPACVFWQGWPEPASSEVSAHDHGQAVAAWLRHLLVRVTRKPVLDLEWVLTLGDDYELPIERYLQAIGFTPQPVVAAVEAGALLELAEAPAQPETLAHHAAFRGCVPPPHVQGIFRLVARTVGLPAAQLWLMPSSEFFFTYHVHLTDDEKAVAQLPTVGR